MNHLRKRITIQSGFWPPNNAPVQHSPAPQTSTDAYHLSGPNRQKIAEKVSLRRVFYSNCLACAGFGCSSCLGTGLS